MSGIREGAEWNTLLVAAQRERDEARAEVERLRKGTLDGTDAEALRAHVSTGTRSSFR